MSDQRIQETRQQIKLKHEIQFIGRSQMDNYRILQVIGEGTYGKVFKAQEKDTGRVVAIKKFKQREDEDPHVRKTMMREIRILREYRHVNIVNLRTVFRENGKLYLIFDYIQKTLLEELQMTPDGLPFERIKNITYQILKANNYLHEGKIIHRDIKPENLLISKAGVLKLCDFGFARPLNSSATYQYTDYVSTRWYRAPELLVGDAAYSGTVDVWAIGCIFAEIFNGMPLFPGDSDLHTLQLILETVTADDIEHEKEIQELSKKQRVAFRMNPLFEGQKVPLASESIKSPETVHEVSLKSLLKGINDVQLDFIRKCLVIDGGQRAKMTELLEHPVFDEEFKASFDAKIQEMMDQDEKLAEELTKEVLTTKDGRPELGPEDLVTEDEKNDDDDDDDDEFDDDDSSSAVGSNGTSSVDTPGSSSGVGQNNIQDYRLQQTPGESREHESSFKTTAPNVGDGLHQIDVSGQSVDHLLPQNSMVSVYQNITENQHHEQKDENTEVSVLSSIEVSRTKLLMMSSKNLEGAPSGSQGNATTDDSPQDQQQVLAQSSSPEEQKDNQNSSEQLQITQGVNGTASLKQVVVETRQDHQDTKQNSMVKLAVEQDEKKLNDRGHQEKNQMQKSSTESNQADQRNHTVNSEYFPIEIHSTNASGQETLQQTPIKVQKRTSLNHYIIESSITEEIREENYSDKTSSEKTSHNTPKDHVRDDHVIMQEGVTSMFQHPASIVETDEGGTEAGIPESAREGEQKSKFNDQNKNKNYGDQNSANSITQIKIGAKTKDASITNDDAVASPKNSQTVTKVTSNPNSSELRNQDSMEVPPDMQRMRSRAQTLADKNSQNLSDENSKVLKQQNTEDFAKQDGVATAQLLAEKQNQSATQSALKTKPPSGARQISKVNITFGASQQQQPSNTKAQNSLINLQMVQANTDQGSQRRSSHQEVVVGSNTASSLITSQVQNINNINGSNNNNHGAALDSSKAATMKTSTNNNNAGGAQIGNNSSRAVVNLVNENSNQPQQRSSISLKHVNPLGAQAVINNQTARETPNNKASLVTPSPATIQQHQLGVEGSGLRQNALDSTAAKTSQGGRTNNFQNNNGSIPKQEMSVTQFSGKPIYQVQKYPQTQQKGPGPKQIAILKQTASVEKLEDQGMSPHKLPNLKPMNGSSMSQYGQQIIPKPTSSDDTQRVGEGLVNLQQHNNRQGPNSITNHFNSHHQRHQPAGYSNNMGAAGGGSSSTMAAKLASGSSQSLTNKLNFTSQNYHRASNSQTNETVSGVGNIQNHNKHQINTTIPSSSKKSQQIQPLKLVAFPKLMQEEVPINTHNHPQISPKHGGSQTLQNTLVGNRKTTGNGVLFSKAKPTPIQKKNINHPPMSQPPPQLNQQMMSSKTQASRMPKRYSDMGFAPGPNGTGTNQAKFANVQGGNHVLVNQNSGGQNAANNGPAFHPTLTNEYMLSQDSLVLNEANSNSKPSRQSSHNLNMEMPSVSQKNQNSVDSHRPRNQAPSHLSSNPKSRIGPGSINNNQVANQSFHSTMKSKNNKFIHQNSSSSHHPTKGSNGINNVSQSGVLASGGKSIGQQQHPKTQEKKIHQHFMEEFSEATSQRQSIGRPRPTAESMGITSTPQKTAITTLFQKSKFFQSQSSNAENNPNSINVPSGYHQHQLSNHYGQNVQQTSSSPSRTLHQPNSSQSKQNEINMLSNFTEKDSFPRRNITNKLRNANNNLQAKKTKFSQMDSQQHASNTSSPSPLSLHQNRENNFRGQNSPPNGIVLPNLGTQNQVLTHPTPNANINSVFANGPQQSQQHTMQVSLTQLHSTANDNHRTSHLSQSPNIVKTKEKSTNLGIQKLSTVANVVQLNASEFNLRLTNNSQLSNSIASKGHVLPYQQIVRKPPSVIQPARAQQYQMYLTPSQNYTSGQQTQPGGSTNVRSQKNAAISKKAPLGGTTVKNPPNGSSPTSLNKKISQENNLQVHKFKPLAAGQQARSPGINGGSISYKVKTETDWHRGSQQQLFEGSNLGQSNQLYRVSNQFLEKSISPQRIQQAMKRGSNVQMMSSKGGISIVGGPAGNYTENTTSTFSKQQQRRRQTGAGLEGAQAAQGAASSGMIQDSSQDSLPVQSPNLLRKKFVTKQQNQIK